MMQEDVSYGNRKFQLSCKHHFKSFNVFNVASEYCETT